MTNHFDDGLEDETAKNEVVKVDSIGSEAMPAEIAEIETVEPDNIEFESVDAEIEDESEDGDDAGEASSTHHRSSGLLTAKTLFKLALKVSAGDPARQAFGFYYEEQLRRECAAMLEFPIERNDRAGLEYAIAIRRYNPGVFLCAAIDTVLYTYWNACFMKEAKQ